MLVKQYLKEFTAEQLQASIASKQAVPLFADKLLLLSRHIEKRLLLSSLSPNEMLVTARDLTLHSFRSGCALTLAFSGSPLADVMSHVSWSNSKTALYYLKLADIIKAGAPADLLTSAPSQSQEASRIYEDYNALKDFVSAFPVSYSSSFKVCSSTLIFPLCCGFL